MGYRATLETNPETVQDLEISAARRLDDALVLYLQGRYHTAIYIAGLSAEMYLKTACFFLDGASPADPVAAHLGALRPGRYKPPFPGDFESGHGLFFWSQEIIRRRKDHGLPKAPNRFLTLVAYLYSDWYIGMRYRPGSATEDDAARFIQQVEWLASNHDKLRG